MRDPGPDWLAGVRPLADEVRWWQLPLVDVTLSADRFLAHGGALFACVPARAPSWEYRALHVRLTNAAGRCADLAASPHAALLFSLDLSTCRPPLVDADVVALAASPHFGRLVWLDLSKNAIGAPGFEALAASSAKTFPELRYLDLALNAAQDPGDERVDWDGGAVEWRSRPEADALEAAYGPLVWLHGERPRRAADFWPRRG